MTDDLLTIRHSGNVSYVTLNRPEKRNAFSDRLIEALDAFFAAPPPETRVVIVSGAGGHFSAGLDLSEHQHRDAEGTMRHSRNWHRIMDRVQYGGLPVVGVLEGAVIGGGLELAAACHVRVAEPSAMFQLPEGKRGIFVGGGGSVRIGRILGADRMIEMMLTGRKYSADEGLALGLTHYVVGDGHGMAKAEALAASIASNAP
jgi:enoyl-CoA hydratase/carnithine racemase